MAKNVQMAKATFANAQTGVGRVATQQATPTLTSLNVSQNTELKVLPL